MPPEVARRIRIDDSASDADLAERVRVNDLDALDHLFQRHAAALLHLASRLTGSCADGEDVVQDVFVGLGTALRGYQERGQFAPWLRRVTARTALMSLRRNANRREVAADVAHDRATIASSPSDRIVLDEAIASLPDALRIVFVLAEIEGYSHDEIAATLDIRAGTSKVRLFRAIRQLRQLLRSDI